MKKVTKKEGIEMIMTLEKMATEQGLRDKLVSVYNSNGWHLYESDSNQIKWLGYKSKHELGAMGIEIINRVFK